MLTCSSQSEKVSVNTVSHSVHQVVQLIRVVRDSAQMRSAGEEMLWPQVGVGVNVVEQQVVFTVERMTLVNGARGYELLNSKVGHPSSLIILITAVVCGCRRLSSRLVHRICEIISLGK